MIKHWIRSALAVMLGGWASSAWADPPVLDQPNEPVVNIVGKHRLDDFSEPAPVRSDLVNRSALLPTPYEADDENYAGFPSGAGGRFTVYGGSYFIYPAFQSNYAFTTSNAAGGGGNNVSFSQHMNYAPMAGIAYNAPNNWGFRARWFGYTNDTSLSGTSSNGQVINFASPLAATTDAASGTIAASSRLHIDSWDGEATKSFARDLWNYQLGGGVRYAHIGQTYDATRTPINAGTLDAAHTDHSFGGIGPTFSLAARRQLGFTGLALYGSAHASVLFGQDRLVASTSLAGGVGQTLDQRNFHVLPVGEFEVGVEYKTVLARTHFFMQAGFVGQVWWNAGSSSDYDPIAASPVTNSNFGLIGLAVRAGFTF